MSITEGEAIKMLKCACVRFCSRPRRRCSAPKKGSSPVPGNSSSTAECGEKLHHIGHTTLCGDAREGRYGKGKTPGGPAGGWRKDRFINNGSQLTFLLLSCAVATPWEAVVQRFRPSSSFLYSLGLTEKKGKAPKFSCFF